MNKIGLKILRNLTELHNIGYFHIFNYKNARMCNVYKSWMLGVEMTSLLRTWYNYVRIYFHLYIGVCLYSSNRVHPFLFILKNQFFKRKRKYFQF